MGHTASSTGCRSSHRTCGALPVGVSVTTWSNAWRRSQRGGSGERARPRRRRVGSARVADRTGPPLRGGTSLEVPSMTRGRVSFSPFPVGGGRSRHGGAAQSEAGAFPAVASPALGPSGSGGRSYNRAGLSGYRLRTARAQVDPPPRALSPPPTGDLCPFGPARRGAGTVSIQHPERLGHPPLFGTTGPARQSGAGLRGQASHRGRTTGPRKKTAAAEIRILAPAGG